MAVLTELFAATHDKALARAAALDAGRDAPVAHHVELPSVTPVDLEVLGEIAARAVRFGSGDLEMAEVDLEHESLFRMPAFLCEVLVELGTGEDPDLPAEVAAEWAATEEMSGADGARTDLLPVLLSIIELVRKAQAGDLEVYQWVEDLSAE